MTRARLARWIGAGLVAAAIPLATAPAASGADLPLPVTLPAPPTLPELTVPLPSVPPLPALSLQLSSVPAVPVPSLHAVPVPSLPAVPVPSPATLPGGDSPVPSASAPLPPTGGVPGVGGTGPLNPCAVTQPLTDAGAPIAASCPLTTSNGGGDGSLCLVISLHPSCTEAQSVTTTTVAGGGDNGGGGNGGGSDTTPPTDPGAGNGTPLANVAAAHRSGTLPFTGATGAAALVAIGGVLAAAGAALARARKRAI